MTQAETSKFIRLRCVEDGDCLRWYTKAKSEVRRRHPLVRLPDGDRQVLARRALYEAEKGPIRDGYSLTPACGSEFCIEPAHQVQLSLSQRAVIGGQAAAGSPTRAANVREARVAAGYAVLTPERLEEIRASGETGLALAARFDVHPKTISDVRLGKTWADLTHPFRGLA